MTKADIVEHIAEKMGYQKKYSAELVELAFKIMKDTLVNGENLKINGFGNFAVKKKADRQGRNPQTGEPMKIVARSVIKFKPSPVFKEFINI